MRSGEWMSVCGSVHMAWFGLLFCPPPPLSLSLFLSVVLLLLRPACMHTVCPFVRTHSPLSPVVSGGTVGNKSFGSNSGATGAADSSGMARGSNKVAEWHYFCHVCLHAHTIRLSATAPTQTDPRTHTQTHMHMHMHTQTLSRTRTRACTRHYVIRSTSTHLG